MTRGVRSTAQHFHSATGHGYERYGSPWTRQKSLTIGATFG